jgi:hypothetical protein
VWRASNPVKLGRALTAVLNETLSVIRRRRKAIELSPDVVPLRVRPLVGNLRFLTYQGRM